MCLIFYLLCIFFTYLISKAALGASGTGSTSSFAAFGGKADYAISDFVSIRFCTLFLLSKNKARIRDKHRSARSLDLADKISDFASVWFPDPKLFR